MAILLKLIYQIKIIALSIMVPRVQQPRLKEIWY
jgi:hypothetical protein